MPASNVLTGGPVTGYDPRYGGIPSAPDPSAESLAAVLANINNLAKITALAGGAGGASAEGARSQILKSIPQFDALLGQFSENVGAGSRGELSPSLRAQINQNLAEYGTKTGSQGPAADAARLRALGLTSEEVQRRALQDMATLKGLAPTGPEFNPSSMFTDPSTQLMWQWLANQLKSAPVPGEARRDELNRQADAFRSGYNVTGPGFNYGGRQTGQPGTGQDMSWLKDIINRGTQAPGQTPVVPVANPNAVADISSRSWDDLTNEWLDYVDPVASGAYEQSFYQDPSFQEDLDYVFGGSEPDWFYDIGTTPADTSYNPYTDQETYNPYDYSWFE